MKLCIIVFSVNCIPFLCKFRLSVRYNITNLQSRLCESYYETAQILYLTYPFCVIDFWNYVIPIYWKNYRRVYKTSYRVYMMKYMILWELVLWGND